MKTVKKLFLAIPLLTIITTVQSHGMSWVKSIFFTPTIKNNNQHDCHTSTQKIIWEGKIGTHNVKVVHSCRFILNGITYEDAILSWEKNKPLFEKLLPHIRDEKNILINMCQPDGIWSVTTGWSGDALDKELVLHIGNDIKNNTQEENAFNLAHEISHVILEHGKKLKYFITEEQCALSRQHEKEADLHAAQILGCAEGGISYWHNRNHTITNNSLNLLEIYDTHPTHSQRTTYLKEWQQNHKHA